MTTTFEHVSNITDTIKAPSNPAALREFIRTYLKVNVRRVPLLDGHSAPMDYLEHAFFGDRVGSCAPSDCVVWANRGGGKTFLGAVATLLDMLFKPGITIRILGGSDHQSRFMLSHLRRLLDDSRNPEIASWCDAKVLASSVIFANGSHVEVLSQSQTSVRGTRVQKLRCDEVDLFKPEIWEACQLTTISATCGDIEVAGTIECLSTMQNAGGMMSRVIAEAEERKRILFRWGVLDVLGTCDDTRACRSSAGDCALVDDCRGLAKAAPESDAGHLSIRDAINLKSRVSLDTWRSEMLCRKPRRSESVFPEFDRSKHTFDVADLPPNVRAVADGAAIHGHRIVAGMDFGFTNPTAIVWAVVDPADRFWIIADYERSEERLEDQIEMIIQGTRAPKPAWIAVDPAGGAKCHQTGTSAVEVMRTGGLCVLTPRSTVASGINLLRSLLSPAVAHERSRIMIDRRCRALIDAMESFRNNPRTGEPIKSGADHLCDALRYMIVAANNPPVGRFSHYLAN